MKNKTVLEKFTAGVPIMVVEYRSSKAEQIRWRDKESRAMVEAPMLRHSCEATDGTPYIINERVPDTFDVNTFQAAFKKGDKVVLTFSSMSVEKGLAHFSGKMEPLEKD